jgi:hypothetical protein
MLGLGIGLHKNRFRGGIDSIKKLINAFKIRVLADGGTFEAEQCLKDSLPVLIENGPSLLVTPNAGKEGKLFSIIPADGAGDLDVARATSATRVDENGLIENVPYNLFNYSEDFSQNYWFKGNGTITTEVITAPDGTLTADLFTKTSNINQTSSISRPATTYHLGDITISLYVKKNVGDTVGLRLVSGTQFNYDFSTNTFNNVQGTLLAYGAQDVGNGWIRLYLTAEATGAVNPYVLNMFSAENNDSVYIWGAQIAKGYIKDYIKTIERENIPRLDYSNGSCPSILVEPQRTNLLLRSEEFDNSYWTKLNGTIIVNDIIAPNGAMTVDLFTKTSGVNSVASVLRTAPYSTTGIHTLSVYIKPKVGNVVLLRLDGGTNSANSLFNFTTKTFTNTGANVISSAYKELPNGWFRLSVTGNVTNISTPIDVCNLFGNPAGDAMWIWGAQLEEGTFKTSYIPTYDTTVTRTNEGLSLSDLTTNSIVSATGGTWFIHLLDNIPITKTNSTSTDRGIFIADSSAGTTNSINIRRLTNGTLKRVEIAKAIGGSTTGNIYTTTSDEVKLVIRYNIGVAGSFDVFENGVKVITTSAFTGDTPLTYVGTRTSPSALESPFINIKSMALFNTQLSDVEAIQLTTL